MHLQSDGTWTDAPTHTHRCSKCRRLIQCMGELQRNHDGEPEVICLAFHVDAQDRCVACAEHS